MNNINGLQLYFVHSEIIHPLSSCVCTVVNLLSLTLPLNSEVYLHELFKWPSQFVLLNSMKCKVKTGHA